jgi:hypothetical protein
MRRFHRFRPIVSGAALLALALTTRVAHAQKKGDAPAAPAGAAGASAKFLGMRRCAMCHRQSETPDPEVTREFCLLNEVTVFRLKDKHAKAFQLLKGDLGKQIGKKLNKDVAQLEECLSCHSGWLSQQGLTKPPSFESGVTCESCHGPSQRWDQLHSEPSWRQTPITEKKDMDMIDVRDPVRRAELCFSCHIGNSDEGKVVTHEMYAAGHPPLPSIEIETFVAAMPAHSRKLEEKGDFQFRKEFIAGSRPSANASQVADGLPRTKGVLVGGIMALCESLQLFAKTLRVDVATAYPCASTASWLAGAIRMPCTASAANPASSVAQPCPGLNASGFRRSGIA